MSAPAYVSELGHFNSNSASSQAVTIPASTTVNVGDTIFLGFTYGNTTIQSVADSQGNTWVQDQSQTTPTSSKTAIYSCRVTTALTTGDTITVTLNAAVGMLGSAAWVTGRVGAVNVTSSATGTSTAPSTTTASSAVADRIVIGCIGWVGGSTADLSAIGNSANQIRLDNNTTGTFLFTYRTVTGAAATEQVSATITSRNWRASAAVYKGSTIRYVDYAKADNTGSGITSFANAVKDLSSSGALVGDVVHMAKSADNTALTGTLAWTDNSTSVTTSVDLTGSLAAKDFVGPATDGSQGWFEISSITATTITLVQVYTGTTQTLASFKLGSFDAGAPAASTTDVALLSTAGTTTDHITVIGGYDTSNDTRTGYTNFRVSGSKNGRVRAAGTFQDWSYIGSFRTFDGLSFGTADLTLTNFFAGGCSNSSLISGGRGVYTNGVLSSGAGGISSGAVYAQFTNITVLTMSATAQGGTGGAQCTFTNCVFNRSTGNSLSTSSSWLRFVGCTFKNSSGSGVSTAISGGHSFANCTFSNNSTADFTGGVTWAPIWFYNCLLSSTTPVAAGGGMLFFDRWQQTAGVYRQYHPQGNIFSDTANARADTCVALSPTAGVDQMLDFMLPIPATSGTLRTVTFYVKHASWNGNKCFYGLRFNGEWVSGSPVTTSPTTSYVLHTFTYTPSEDGVIELYFQFAGTAGSIYIDDVAWT